MLTTDILHAAAVELTKMAQEGAKKPPHPAAVGLRAIGLYGAGVGAGLGALHLLDRHALKRYKKPLVSGSLARAALPALGGGVALLSQGMQKDLGSRIAEAAKARKRT